MNAMRGCKVIIQSAPHALMKAGTNESLGDGEEVGHLRGSGRDLEGFERFEEHEEQWR